MSSFITNQKRKSYDVYLSFCAKDSSFGLKLHKTLTSDYGVLVFLDYTKLGSRIHIKTPSPLNVIGECKIAVIVFSRNYANSRSCIQELEKITEYCRTTTGLIVLPVFYDGVYPCDGRLKSGMFGVAFHDLVDGISIKETSQERDKFMSWVEAISNKALKYSGSRYSQHKQLYRNESEYISNAVERVMHVINKKRDLFGVSYTASVKSGVQDVIQLLKQSKRTLLLGIWGMVGIGKSTIAKEIYDQIGPYFEDKSFINVSIVQGKNDGQVFLQDDLLFDIGMETEMNIPTVESGKVILEQRLRNKRVLLILDNVDKLEQLQALSGSREWFGEGSKIIITTRDRHLLKEHGVDHIYSVKKLNEFESLELFNFGAFSQATTPGEYFGELSRQVVSYCGGLPLALITFGGFLHGKEELEWKVVLNSLESNYIPVPRLLKALLKSFSDLSDEKNLIFLDIACFFIGMNQNDVLQTLKRSTQCATLQISLLEDMSLVTIDGNNKLEMHVLLQAMARDIIKSKSRNKTNQPKMYDVFLSFRGEDSRVKFISHLYSSLQNAGIYVFRDDDEIHRGDQISLSLLQAIGKCRISIVVLSTNYANSRWCMLELEKIMEIGRTRGLVVMPVFYEVDPSEVRHQEGLFGKAFEYLISTISVADSTMSKWRRELFDIGGIAGFVLIDSRLKNWDPNLKIYCCRDLWASSND